VRTGLRWFGSCGVTFVETWNIEIVRRIGCPPGIRTPITGAQCTAQLWHTASGVKRSPDSEVKADLLSPVRRGTVHSIFDIPIPYPEIELPVFWCHTRRLFATYFSMPLMLPQRRPRCDQHKASGCDIYAQDFESLTSHRFGWGDLNRRPIAALIRSWRNRTPHQIVWNPPAERGRSCTSTIEGEFAPNLLVKGHQQRSVSIRVPCHDVARVAFRTFDTSTCSPAHRFLTTMK
jgi:hypothetical protein